MSAEWPQPTTLAELYTVLNVPVVDRPEKIDLSKWNVDQASDTNAYTLDGSRPNGHESRPNTICINMPGPFIPYLAPGSVMTNLEFQAPVRALVQTADGVAFSNILLSQDESGTHVYDSNDVGGSIAEFTTPGTSLTNCENRISFGPATTTDLPSGGLVYSATGTTFTNCRNYGNFELRAGGITAIAKDCTFEDCTNEGSFTVKRCGGIVSTLLCSSLNRCTNSGSFQGSECGGLVYEVCFDLGGTASLGVEIKDCTNSGAFYQSNCGGLVCKIWYQSGTPQLTNIVVSGCTNSGQFNGLQSGGLFYFIIAIGSITVTQCNNTGTFNTFWFGGLVYTLGASTYPTSFVGCNNSGLCTITSAPATSYFSGGLVNILRGSATFESCTTNTILKEANSGGLVARLSASRVTKSIVSFTNCSNTGDFINLSGGSCAGLVRSIDAFSNVDLTLTGCFNSGSFLGPNCAGLIRNADSSLAAVTLNTCRNNGLFRAQNSCGLVFSHTAGTLAFSCCLNRGDFQGTNSSGFAGSIVSGATFVKCANRGNFAQLSARGMLNTVTIVNNVPVTVTDCYNLALFTQQQQIVTTATQSTACIAFCNTVSGSTSATSVRFQNCYSVSAGNASSLIRSYPLATSSGSATRVSFSRCFLYYTGTNSASSVTTLIRKASTSLTPTPAPLRLASTYTDQKWALDPNSNGTTTWSLDPNFNLGFPYLRCIHAYEPSANQVGQFSPDAFPDFQAEASLIDTTIPPKPTKPHVHGPTLSKWIDACIGVYS